MNMLRILTNRLSNFVHHQLNPSNPNVIYYITHIARFALRNNADTKKSFLLHSLEIRNVSQVPAKSVKVTQFSLPHECRTMKIRAPNYIPTYIERPIKDDCSEIIFPILAPSTVVEILYLYPYSIHYPYTYAEINGSLPQSVTYKGGRAKLIDHFFNLSVLK